MEEVNLNNCNNIAIGKSNYFGLIIKVSTIYVIIKITEEDNLKDLESSEDYCENK